MTDATPLSTLQRRLDTALTEIDSAITAWETLRPANSNERLLKRVSNTYDAHAFLTIRSTLAMQVASALARLWDKDRRTVGFKAMASELSKNEVRSAISDMFAEFEKQSLRRARLARSGKLVSSDHYLHNFLISKLPESVEKARNQAFSLILDWENLFGLYEKEKISCELRNLKSLRDKRLSHHDLGMPYVHKLKLTELGRILRASEILVEKGMLVTKGENISLLGAHKIASAYARSFWSAVAESELQPLYRTRPEQPPKL